MQHDRVSTEMGTDHMKTHEELGLEIASNFPKARRFMERLNICTPIIQAPMAGIGTDEWLQYFTNNHGKIVYLPSYGAGYIQAEEIATKISYYKKHTTMFNFNLFIPSKTVYGKSDDQKINLGKLWEYLSPHYKELGARQPEIPSINFQDLFLNQLEVLLEHKVPVFSFTFGRLSPKYIEIFKDNGTFVIGSATSAKAAQQLINDGCDAIVLQSPCAGGHLSLFEGETISDPTITSIELACSAQIDEWKVPCIMAGGIRQSKEVERLFKLGASAIQLGTSFLACKNSGLPTNYQNAIALKNSDHSVLTPVISGRMARAINNHLYQIMFDYYKHNQQHFPPYPWPHLLTAPLRAAAAKINDFEHLASWCGINKEQIPPCDFSEISKAMLDFS